VVVYDRRGLTCTLGDVAMTLCGHARPLSTHKLQVTTMSNGPSEPIKVVAKKTCDSVLPGCKL
jgi:hypothetical protein